MGRVAVQRVGFRENVYEDGAKENSRRHGCQGAIDLLQGLDAFGLAAACVHGKHDKGARERREARNERPENGKSRYGTKVDRVEVLEERVRHRSADGHLVGRDHDDELGLVEGLGLVGVVRVEQRVSEHFLGGLRSVPGKKAAVVVPGMRVGGSGSFLVDCGEEGGLHLVECDHADQLRFVERLVLVGIVLAQHGIGQLFLVAGGLEGEERLGS